MSQRRVDKSAGGERTLPAVTRFALLHVPLCFFLAAACGEGGRQPTPDEHAHAPAAAEQTAGQTSAKDPSTPLDAYLAAIPSEQPTSSPAVTGIAGDDPDTDVPRCQKTGWSYYQCARVFPEQGLQWVRWACMHEEPSDSRGIMCTRLAEYLYQGVGGPRNPDIANALFDRQCLSDAPSYRSNCYSAAEAIKFDDPTRALAFAKRGCDSEKHSPIGCGSMLPQLEAGLKARKVIVEQAEGLTEIAVGSECRVWLWSTEPGSCGARMACGEAVLYGAEGSVVPCKDDGTGGEDMTTSKDDDPAFRLDANTVELRDDESGRLGAFTLRGRVE